jgi:hypothetical protein
MLAKFRTDVLLRHLRNNFETCLNPRQNSSSSGVEKVAQFDFERASMQHESHDNLVCPITPCFVRQASIGVAD